MTSALHRSWLADQADKAALPVAADCVEVAA